MPHPKNKTKGISGILEKYYPYRFQIFFFSQMAILFGSLIVPAQLFETILTPLLFLLNLLAGILLISKKKHLMRIFIALLVLASIVFGFSLMDDNNESVFNFIRMIIYFLFYVVVTLEIVKQVWKSKIVNKNVILGLISGYVSLGLIGFFICLTVETVHPGSFLGILTENTFNGIWTEQLMYYSFITLLTIGYGDILPVTALAHKAAILIGLMGQLYLVILTAIVVGKFINQSRS